MYSTSCSLHDVWSLNLSKKPLPNPFPRGPGFSKVMWLHQATRTMAIASVKVSRLTWWAFGCSGGSPDDFWVRKCWNRKKRERERGEEIVWLYDCYVMIHRFLEVSWPGDESETPKIVQKTRFFSGLSAPGPRVGARLVNSLYPFVSTHRICAFNARQRICPLGCLKIS